MAQDDRVETLAGRPRGPSVLLRWSALAALGLLIGFIVHETRTIWAEWRNLQGELVQIERSNVIGYENINARPSFADKPNDWIHDEGESTLLWSGWKPGSGHGWFRVGRGEVDRARISNPMGRDVIQAIDWPIIEVGGGIRWERIPQDARVVGLEVAGISCAYPLLLLEKVEVVNDTVNDRPILVLNSPFVPAEKSCDVFDPMFKGQRLTMGLSGYLRDHKPVLYDRGTESLWVIEGNELKSFAGRLKGSALRRIQHPIPVAWNDWRSQHPRGRLVVGADRSRGVPTQ